MVTEAQRKRDRAYYIAHKEEKKRYSREYTKTHKEKIRKTKKAYHQKNPTRRTAWFLKRTYGISLVDYLKLFAKQKGCCALCRRHQSEFKRRLCVDHDHKTKRVRGLLCPGCNRALGVLGDSVKRIKLVLKYLKEKHSW